jgi:hypothetical protein
LGLTVNELDISNAALKLEKTEFTMLNKEVKDFLDKKGIKVRFFFNLFLFKK